MSRASTAFPIQSFVGTTSRILRRPKLAGDCTIEAPKFIVDPEIAGLRGQRAGMSRDVPSPANCLGSGQPIYWHATLPCSTAPSKDKAEA
jgi:hypothetical protein